MYDWNQHGKSDMSESKIINVEIKARADELSTARKALQEEGARFEGTDHQVDTYFCVEEGRLKLREGNIERSLIHYNRPDEEAPSSSHVSLMRLDSRDDCRALREVLGAALGVLVTVEKEREIYYLGNIKIHLDTVEGLGTFVEIEAAGEAEVADEAELQNQCEQTMQLLKVADKDLVATSYSDMLIPQKKVDG